MFFFKKLFLFISCVYMHCAFSQAGSLDGSYGSGGYNIFNLSPAGKSDIIHSILNTTDNKIIIAGGTDYNTLLPINYDACIARLQDNGQLDTTFSTSGVFNAHFTHSSYVVKAIALQDDNKIVACGNYDIAGLTRAFILRLTENGFLDTTFNGIGYFELSDGDTITSFEDVALLSDGRIVVAGKYQPYSTDSDFMVVMFNANGTFNSDFADNGFFIASGIFSSDDARKIIVQPDDKILVGGTAYNAKYDYFAARLTADGYLDSDFGIDGKVLIDVQHPGASDEYFTGMALQADGKIIIGGSSDFHGSPVQRSISIVRILNNGFIDSTFGDAGFAIIQLCDGSIYPDEMKFDAEQRILVAYSAPACYQDGVLRLLQNGAPDTTFGEAGFAALIPDYTGPFALEIMDDSSIYLAMGEATDLLNTDVVIIKLSGDNPLPCAAAPDALYADGITANKAKLHWSADPDAIKYKVQFRKTTEAVWTTTNAVNNFKNIISLEPSATYKYRIKTICATGVTSAWSTIANFTTLSARLVYEPDAPYPNILIYPNPAGKNFTIKVYANSTPLVKVNIRNLSGVTVFEKYFHLHSEQELIAIESEQPEGLYLISVDLGEVLVSQSLYITQ